MVTAERTKAKLLFGVACMFCLQYAYLLIPYGDDLHQPFPLFKFSRGITWQCYYDYLFKETSYLIPIYVLGNYLPEMKSSMRVFFWLWVGFIIEYCLVYNQPFLWISFIPISYSLFAGLAMSGIVFYEFFKSK